MLIPASKFLHFIKSHTCVGEKVQQVKFDQLILIPGKLQVIDQRWVNDWLMVVFQVWDGLASTNIHRKYYQEQHGIIKKLPAENNMSDIYQCNNHLIWAGVLMAVVRLCNSPYRHIIL